VRSTEDACDVDRHLDYAALVTEHIAEREVAEAPVLLGGDLNVFDGFEEGPVIADLVGSGLVDVFRVAEPTADGTTFEGNDWAPAGRIDYVFATAPVDVLDAAIDRDAVPTGEGSDHYAVYASVEF
jgi:endonuclease/exonuclease/phosphatase family metal-dependent hydrolase